MPPYRRDPANRVAVHCYFDVNVRAEGRGHQVSPGAGKDGGPDRTEFPNASAAFRRLFSSER